MGSTPIRATLEKKEKFGMKGTGRPRVLGTRESRFDSDHPDCMNLEMTERSVV
jgi:hypothetical protein